MDATFHRMTGIGGAGILVVAVGHYGRFAFPGRAVVPVSTWIAVIALAISGRVLTSTLVVAQVISAGIAVVAVECEPGLAHPVLAEIVEGAWIAVSTRDINVLVLASAVGQTEVFGARVVIVAIYAARAYALAITALVICGARVEVVTVGQIGVVVAPQRRVAEVIGADVAIVATQCLTRNTTAGNASIAVGALVPIIAGIGVVIVRTTGQWNADVVGARVVVVAVLGGSAHAVAARALVQERAGVLIIAGLGVVRVQASLERAANIVGAEVGVVAIEGLPGKALPLQAEVIRSAHVAVITGGRIELVGTPLLRQAGIPGAGVAVIAVNRRGTLAGTIETGFTVSALVAVFTGKTVVCRNRLAVPI